jgi:hypothetical protein
MSTDNGGSVVAFPRDHLREFMQLTSNRANERGHSLGEWQRHPNVLYAYCIECGAYAGIDWFNEQKLSDHLEARGLEALQDPAINLTTDQPRACGDALSESCPSPHAPWHPDHEGRLGAKNSPARTASRPNQAGDTNG